ncbi:unnamed protein product [Lota lota]
MITSRHAHALRSARTAERFCGLHNNTKPTLGETGVVLVMDDSRLSSLKPLDGLEQLGARAGRGSQAVRQLPGLSPEPTPLVRAPWSLLGTELYLRQTGQTGS